MAGRPAPWSVKHREIKEGDSKVLVTDTGTGQVDMIVDGSTVQSWTVSGGAGFPTGSLSLGVDDTTAGVLTIYGSDGATGGRVRLYAGETDDDYDDFFDLEVDGGYLKLKDDGGLSILSYQSSVEQLELHKSFYNDTGTFELQGTTIIQGSTVTLGPSTLNITNTANFTRSGGVAQASFGTIGSVNALVYFRSTEGPMGQGGYIKTDDNGFMEIGVNETYPEIRIQKTSGPDVFRLNCTQPIEIGVPDLIAGRLKMLGNASSEGAWIQLWNEADARGYDDYYQLKANNGVMELTAQSGQSIMRYVSSTGQLELDATLLYLDVPVDFASYEVDFFAGFKIGGVTVTATAAELNYNDLGSLGQAYVNKAVVLDGTLSHTGIRNLTLGQDNFAAGTLRLYASDEDSGGRIYFHNAQDATGTSTYWKLQSYEADSGNSNMTFGHTNKEILNIWDSNNTIYLQSACTLDCSNGTFNVSSTNNQINGVNVTAEAAELNYNDLTTGPGTAEASKAVVLDASKNITGLNYVTGDRFLTSTTQYLSGSVENTGGFTVTVNGNENAIIAAANGAVSLYYDDTIKVATYADGISVTNGTLLIDGTAKQIVSNTSFNVLVGSTENAIVCTQNGGVELYYDNTKTFETIDNGIQLTGNNSTELYQLYATGGIQRVHFDQNNGGVIHSISDSGGTTRNMIYLVPGGTDTKVYLYAGAGVSVFKTTDDGGTGGFDITRGGSVGASMLTTSGSGALTIKNNHDGGIVYLKGESTASTEVDMMTLDPHGTWTFASRNTADGATNTLMTLNPDGAISLYYAGNVEMSTQANGIALPNGALTTSTGTPIDLTLNCGSQKTLVLSQPVWDDVVVPMSAIRLGGASPASEIAYRGGLAAEFVDTADNYVYMTIQLPHSYKEGTDIDLHIHWTTDGNGSAGGAGTENIGWIATSSASSPTTDSSESWPVETTHSELIVDVNAVTQHEHHITDIATITGTGFKASEVIVISFHRNTAVANNSTLHAIVVSADAHFQKDTLGSRQELIK